MKSKLYLATTSATAVSLSVFVPMLAHAQTIMNILTNVSNILGMLIPMALAAALIAFFWGLAQFLFSGGAEEKGGGKHLMINGILALFVMVSIWGIVALLQRTLGISSITKVPAPTICGQGGCGNFAPNLQ